MPPAGQCDINNEAGSVYLLTNAKRACRYVLEPEFEYPGQPGEPNRMEELTMVATKQVTAVGYQCFFL